MSNLDNYYKRLNGSEDRLGQYALWAPYRHQITEFIKKHPKDIKKTNQLVMIGAGNCNDIDLKSLEAQFGTLTLSDCDLNSMERATLRQGITHYELVDIDYLQCDLKDHFSHLKGPLSLSQLEKMFKDMVHSMSNDHLRNLIADKDTIVVLPIYTQVFFGEVNHYLQQCLLQKAITTDVYHQTIEMVLTIMPKVIQTFNEPLIEAVLQGKRLIVFSDLLEDQPDGPYDQQFLIHNMDQAYERYAEQYGMGLGHYGLYHLETTINLMEAKWFRWPFSADRVMFVKGEVFG